MASPNAHCSNLDGLAVKKLVGGCRPEGVIGLIIANEHLGVLSPSYPLSLLFVLLTSAFSLISAATVAYFLRDSTV